MVVGFLKIFCNLFNWWKGGTLSENILKVILLVEGWEVVSRYFACYFTDRRVGWGLLQDICKLSNWWKDWGHRLYILPVILQMEGRKVFSRYYASNFLMEWWGSFSKYFAIYLTDARVGRRTLSENILKVILLIDGWRWEDISLLVILLV